MAISETLKFILTCDVLIAGNRKLKTNGSNENVGKANKIKL